MHDGNDDSQQARRDALEAMDDYAAAHRLGMNPPDMSAPQMMSAEGLAAVYAWLDRHGMHGAHRRWLAEHGVAVWCPDWCQDAHGPVQMMSPQDAGENHYFVPESVGDVTGVYSVWEAHEPYEREEYVTLTGESRSGFDGSLQIPLGAVPDLIALLEGLRIPDAPA